MLAMGVSDAAAMRDSLRSFIIEQSEVKTGISKIQKLGKVS